MSTLEDYLNAKTRLDELSLAHMAAMRRVNAAKIEYDDATAAERRALDNLAKANEQYVALELKLEAEKATQAAIKEIDDVISGQE